MGKKIEAKIGQKFNRWLVLNEGDKSGYWLCLCECGTKKMVRFDGLINNGSKSCGCLKLEKWIERNTKYKNGEIKDRRFYHIWQGINDRCNNPKYKRYCGRGIKVDTRWNSKNPNGYRNFYYDMYKMYLNHCDKYGIKNTTIERINNDGNYKLDNCRWATIQEQLQNKSKNTKRVR